MVTRINEITIFVRSAYELNRLRIKNIYKIDVTAAIELVVAGFVGKPKSGKNKSMAVIMIVTIKPPMIARVAHVGGSVAEEIPATTIPTINPSARPCPCTTNGIVSPSINMTPIKIAIP